MLGAVNTRMCDGSRWIVLLLAAMAGGLEGTPARGEDFRGAAPVFGKDRVGMDRKGSLLVYPLIELRWTQEGGIWTLTQDTVLTIINDYPEEVWVQLYLANGDQPLPAMAGERAHPGWNNWGVQFRLTANEPTYWSAFNGQPEGLLSFAGLDVGSPPGRPDPENPGKRVLRGYAVAWAVNSAGNEIRWNHLSGSALVATYSTTSAWEYEAWTFQSHGAEHGLEPESCLEYSLESGNCVSSAVVAGRLDLDSFEFDACPGAVMFEFQAADTVLPGGAGGGIDVESSLLLMPCDLDLREGGELPPATRARFDVWNQNEVRFSGMERCLVGWDMRGLRNYPEPWVANYFLVQNLQTDRGKARVDGRASTLCGGHGTVSRDVALLGLQQKVLTFPNNEEARAGGPVSIQGWEAGRVQADVIGPPPEMEAVPVNWH